MQIGDFDMKKILVLMLALIMACTAIVSCGGGAGSYSDLAIIDLGLEREYFGIAFRSGSDMTRKVEDITLQLIEEGKLAELSTTYEVGAIGKGDYTPKADPCEGSGDWDYIKGKGKLVVGITDYKPMDYRDENGNWIGFDADYARAVAAKLGVDVEFKEIEWDFKLEALASKDIDCIWNGMTITEAIENAADCTVPYMYNTQVAVVKKADAAKYKTIADLAGLRIAAESGSAGEKVIQDNASLKDGLKSMSGQTDALLEVLSGSSQAAIVDLTLAKALIK
jgi:polar amino acid transport system substrate-binding protein